MLYLVLILVLGSLGMLIAALITGAGLWAWVSIGLSGAAAVVLVVDWLRRRKREHTDAVAEPGSETEQAEQAEVADEEQEADEAERDREHRGEGTAVPAGESRADSADEDGDDELDDERAEHDPEEEPTDAADLLIVCELDDTVTVIDEHPRYHLDACGWLTDKDTIPIAVSEARDLGFTPCSRCGPDATLASQYRDRRREERAES